MSASLVSSLFFPDEVFKKEKCLDLCHRYYREIQVFILESITSLHSLQFAITLLGVLQVNRIPMRLALKN